MSPGILIDAADEHDGGPLLRAALALSLLGGRSFELVRFQEGRAEPGLRAACLAEIGAAQALCDAQVSGASEASTRLSFEPGRPVEAGEPLLVTPGPAAHLLDVVALPLALAGPSRPTIRGTTHPRGEAGFLDLAQGLSLLWEQLGLRLELTLRAAAFEAGGDGRIDVRVETAGPPRSLDLRRRGTLREVRVVPMSAGLPAEVPVRIAGAAARELRRSGVALEEQGLPLPSSGSQGAAVAIVASYENVTVSFCATADDRPAEAVGREVAAAFLRHHELGMALDPALAVRMLLPLATASAGLRGSPTPIHRFTCSEITPALLATAAVIRRFLPVEIAVFGRPGEPGDVRVAPEGTGEVIRMHGESA